MDAEVIYEDDATVALLDIHPHAPGHTMVIPRVHAETILELPQSAIGPLFETVKKVTAMIKKALQPDGFTIGINHGRKAGQMIDHLHIHILPRFSGDSGGSIHSVVKNPPEKSMQEIRERIRETNNNL